jgi:Cof subfamily protein (haloacid dehalogenase superfamily)
MFDIDGTILDHDNRIPASTKEAITLLQDKGHEVAIATGRAPYFIEGIRDVLNVDSFVCFNGQYVEIGGKTVYQNPIPTELLKKLYTFSSDQTHPLVYMGAKEMKSTVEKHHVVEKCLASLDIDTSDLKMDATYYKEMEVFQTLLFCKEQEETVYRESITDLGFVRWHPQSIDVLPMGGSKAIGVERYMEHQGYDKKNVYAFGDNFNDVEMLQFVGHGVAMGNAPEQVKRIAKYVTKDVAEDGIAHGLERLGLL